MENDVLTPKQVADLTENTYIVIPHLISEINRALTIAAIKRMKKLRIFCCKKAEDCYELNWGENDNFEQKIGFRFFFKATIQKVISLYRKAGWKIKIISNFSDGSGPVYEIDLPTIKINSPMWILI